MAGLWGYHLGGLGASLNMIFIVAILAVMEVSLSFDNAVVNASVLKNWDEYWKKVFLTIGILVAVFGMRLLFPLLIVAQTSDMGILEVWNLAINNPTDYSNKLTHHHAEISAFGGMFLLLVFLNFILDEEKETHWLGAIEERLGSMGRIDSLAIFLAIISLVSSLAFIPIESKLAVLLAGIMGILTYIGVDIIGALLESEEDISVGDVVKKGSIGGFLYLEVLDASFSFDGVIGAFAITKDIVAIMLGLGIGAMFVRSLTIFLVDKGTLDEYVYLEHGAHYAIGVLAFIMLLGMHFHISEIFTGLIGVAFILASLWSSLKYKNQS